MSGSISQKGGGGAGGVSYRGTIIACFIGYIVQAIVNNFLPLLFLCFQSTYHIPLYKITMLITFNFAVQIAVDLLSVTFVDRIGYRASMIICHVCAAGGFVLLPVLPELLPDPFVGILVCVMLYAVGGGLIEVLISPIMESCPTENKSAAMSLLHAFYCWGHMGVVALSTLYFTLVGIEHWKLLALLWAIVPLVNLLLFTRVPIAPVVPEGERGLSMRELISRRLFWVLVVMMVCSGASEQAVSQWTSTFAEKGLGVPKAIGDLIGPMGFALMMGTSRAIFGKWGEKLNLDRFMGASCLLCMTAYVLIIVFHSPVVSLLGCVLCGFSVGIMWPGTFSKATEALPGGGTAMFAFLALAGDIGCSGGPTLVGFIASHANENLKAGFTYAMLFPVVLLTCVLALRKRGRGGA